MALSPTAARALEQVKMGLYMLRGADYFTEEEWIKIDGLIHKGQYIFTNGPQTNIFDGELINFDDTVEDSVQQVLSKSFDPIEEETVQVSEMELSSPTVSDPAEMLDFTAETPNTTSAEVSSDDEPSLANTADTSKPEKPSESTTIPTREPVQLPRNGGLALGYSQAMLDEIKAFNSTLTKAGQKSRPGKSNRSVTESYDSIYDAEAPTSYSEATPTEQDTNHQIQTWASDVQAQERPKTPTPIQAPAPTKTWTSQPLAAAKPPVEAFKDLRGHPPTNVDDLAQRINPSFKPTARPFSRVSHKLTKSAAPSSAPSTPSRGNPTVKNLNVKPGTVLIAQRNYVQKSAIQLDIKSGDQIVYVKHVSAATHVGENQRTHQKGQFFEDTLKKDSAAETLAQQQRARAVGHPGVIGDGRHLRQVSINTVSNTLERMETLNAAEWDDVASVATTNTTNTMTVGRPVVPSAKAAGGLGSSRFASEEEKPPAQGISKEELGELIDERFAQIIAAQAARNQTPSIPSRPPYRSHHKPSLNEPLKKVQPKSTTCWWWATPNKECRFTDDECRDLHGYLPSTGTDPANLRMGKPTWGALADSLPSASSTPTPTPQTETENEGGPNGQGNFGAYKSKTCWFWANDPKGCSNAATECKYLHEKCVGGVANRPASWKKLSWNRFSSADAGSSGEGEGGNGDAENDGGDAWGNVASVAHGWGEDPSVYRPPHIKALEDQALAEAVGW